MNIKHHTFCARSWPPTHFCCASTHICPFEEPKARGRGQYGRTRAAVDLGATLAGSSDKSLSRTRTSSDRPLTVLTRSGRWPIAIFQEAFDFLIFEGKGSSNFIFYNTPNFINDQIHLHTHTRGVYLPYRLVPDT
jgi:hypothetical protein